MTINDWVPEEGYLDGYRPWTERLTLLTAAEERELLVEHQQCYQELVAGLFEQYPQSFHNLYPELNLSGENAWAELWDKRPYGKDILQLMSRAKAEGFLKGLVNPFARWQQVREALLARNIRLVLKVAHQHRTERLSLMDRVQEGQFGLMRALERFDVSRDLRFSTYATHWVTQFIRLAIKKQSRVVRLPTNVQDQVSKVNKAWVVGQQGKGGRISSADVSKIAGVDRAVVEDVRRLNQGERSLNAPMGDENDGTWMDTLHDSSSPDQEVLQRQQRSQVARLLSKLSPREALVLKMRYGIGLPQSYGYREIADQLRLSRERVRQIERDVMKRLSEQSWPVTASSNAASPSAELWF